MLAAGYASRALAAGADTAGELALQAIRGQVSWGRHGPGTAAALPAFPVNGHGSLAPAVPLPGEAGGLAWVMGSSFERDNARAETRPEDDLHNFSRLQTLLPQTAHALAAKFETGQVQSWAGVRCATPSRLPALGPLAPGLWLCSGMGSRGLTFAALCAELLAARLHAEPLALEQRLAGALAPPLDT